MQFLPVIKNMHICSLLSATQGQVFPFYSCEAVSLFLFQLQAHKGEKPFPTQPLLPQLLLWVGEANHSSLWKKKKKSTGNSPNWNFASFPWQQITRVQPNPTLTISGIWYFVREKREISVAASGWPLGVMLIVLVVYKNTNNKKDNKMNHSVFSSF